MRHIFLAALLAALPALADAQSPREAAICKDDDETLERRLTACTAVINAMGAEPQPWAFVERGDAHYDADNYQAALPDLQKAVDLDPGNIRARDKILYSLYQLDRHDAALALADQLIAEVPDEDWYPYRKGLSLQAVGRLDDAMAAYDAAIALNADYYWSRIARGGLHRINRNAEGQLADFAKAVEIRPWSSFAHLRRGDALEKLGRVQEAAASYLVANTINPNQRGAKRFASDLMPLTPISPAPMPWTAPKVGTQIDYLMVVLPVDPRDDMELAIMALANWFAPEPLATPEAKAVIRRDIAAVTDDLVQVTGDVQIEEDLPDFVPRTSTRTLFRGLFPTRFSPVPDLVIRVDHGTPGPEALWPLEVGKEITGQGQMVIECPKKFHFMIALMGCAKDVVEVPIGPIEWGFRADRAEQVLVPRGRFDTYVLRYRELARMELGGVVRNRTAEVNWWVDIDSGIWVRRTAQSQGKIMTEMALRPGGL